MQIEFHRSFAKDATKLSPKVRAQLKTRLALFRKERFHPTLRHHELTGQYKGYMSINITGDVRAVYRPLGLDHIEFTRIGSHSQLYR